MFSNGRIISSQINGALSHGPVTEEGKRRSSLNAVRHGLLSTHSFNDLESLENFDVVVKEHADCFEPQGGVEEGLIEEMVSTNRRMHRLCAIGIGMMNQAIGATSPDDTNLNRITDAYSSLAETPKYNLLNIYEGRLHRRYHRALQSMIALSEYQQRKAENLNGQTNPL